jgi:alkanesulfonate monooxygenase SsuD/methylene tetrahydromethanopterin reductase-like flavin-dependent oxidoreductase (luciferase family)
MRIGVGLPAGIPGVDRDSLLDWARRADALGFDTLGVLDRLVFDNWEPLISLAAAAAVTDRIGLMSTVLTVPNRGNPALVAKQAASLQALSAGRLRLGVGLGARRDDYVAGQLDGRGRGAAFDAALSEMTEVWAGESRGLAGPIGPTPAPRPGLLIGGFAPAAFTRAARFGDGWIGAGPPAAIAAGAAQARSAWRAAGRTDAPWVAAIVYFGLGADGGERAAAYLGDYYAFAGRPEHLLPGDAMADLRPQDLVAAALTDPDAVRAAAAAFAENACDELVFLPVSSASNQPEALAEVLRVEPGGPRSSEVSG